MEPGDQNAHATHLEARLRAGIAAAKAGQRERARDLLMSVVAQDEENVLAWLWLSSVMDSLDDREVCLENVLALDPGNDAARKGLAWVQKQKSEPPTTKPVQAAKPTSLAAALLREDFARHRPPPEPELPPPISPPDEFDNEYLCIYCAGLTHPDDRKCPACDNPLWVKIRRREGRSSWLWVALVMQLASTVWPVTAPFLILTYVAQELGVYNPFTLVPAYLGLSSSVPPDVTQQVFKHLPPVTIVPFIFYFLFSSVVLVGLYLRWKPIFYMFVISALLTLASAMAATIIIQSSARMCSGGGIILALLMLALLLQIEDDFFFDEKRIILRVDRDATNGPALLASGQRYARRALWAMAAIHLRRAASKMPHEIACHLLLATAYIGLKRYDLADQALAQARRISPDDPQVEKLAAVLAQNLPQDQ